MSIKIIDLADLFPGLTVWVTSRNNNNNNSYKAQAHLNYEPRGPIAIGPNPLAAFINLCAKLQE